ncbi:hypothetical protein UCRPA7_6795 [Phaeoacremonium minimum UCRPA7]|uniref:Uncharacterized protein n=1 Tax=Phaeoacremonium minimum (strain UCR-PA7) TaxID=1286976 RepID=R8BDV9_PHAM7|nr:hypothetical protein UCRPA7_6795 [Phaeoacremonium minimum UCRPA7]EON97491.1 hypothetical protein UCRPA7_6795 [Phaeoacremonium minimum UCRPA7]
MELDQEHVGWYNADSPNIESYDFNQEVLDVQKAHQEYFAPLNAEKQYPVQFPEQHMNKQPAIDMMLDQRFSVGSSRETSSMETPMTIANTGMPSGNLMQVDSTAAVDLTMVEDEFDFTEVEMAMNMDDESFDA